MDRQAHVDAVRRYLDARREVFRTFCIEVDYDRFFVVDRTNAYWSASVFPHDPHDRTEGLASIHLYVSSHERELRDPTVDIERHIATRIVARRDELRGRITTGDGMCVLACDAHVVVLDLAMHVPRTVADAVAFGSGARAR
jgi:hypothetical protein